MSSLFRMRPQYERRIGIPPESVGTRLREALSTQDAPCQGEVEDDKVHVMTRGEHHFWSPELRARVESTDAGSHVVGRFGPRPSVWTMFMVIYAHLVFIAIAGGCYAMAQLALGRSPTAGWAIPAALVLAALVHLVARVGQRLGSDEMHDIRDFLTAALESEHSQ